MDPEDLARKAMLAGDNPFPVVAAPEVVATPAPIIITPPPPAANPANDPLPSAQPGIMAKLSTWCKPSNLKVFVNNPLVRYGLVFVITCIVLILVAPPFVQLRRKNQLEKAPTSYKRVLIVAGITTVVVAGIPICLTHKSKFVSLAATVKKWF